MVLSLSALVRHCRPLGVAALLFTLSEAGVIRADEPRGDVPAEAKAKVEALMREARELKEAGKHDEARAVQEKADALVRKLREAAGAAGEKRDLPRPTPELMERAENEIRQRRERAADLRAAGKVDEAEKLEVEAKSMAEKMRRFLAETRGREGAPRDGEPRREGAPRDGEPRREGAPRDGEPRREGAPRDGEPRREGAPRDGEPRREGAPRDGEPRREGAPRDGAPRREGQPPREGAPREGAPREGAPREGAPREGAPRRDGQPPREGERRDAPQSRDVPPSRESQAVREEVRELRETVGRMRAEMEELRNLVRRLVEKNESR